MRQKDILQGDIYFVIQKYGFETHGFTTKSTCAMIYPAEYVCTLNNVQWVMCFDNNNGPF